MPTINCRTANICILCKNWVGCKPEVDFLFGYAKYPVTYGYCKIDGLMKEHKSDGLCRRFERSILYM